MPIDAAAYAAKSDPLRNYQFRRGWELPETSRRREVVRAAALDREADAELMLGHHARAEYLAQQAFALRSWP